MIQRAFCIDQHAAEHCIKWRHIRDAQPFILGPNSDKNQECCRDLLLPVSDSRGIELRFLLNQNPSRRFEVIDVIDGSQRRGQRSAYLQAMRGYWDLVCVRGRLALCPSKPSGSAHHTSAKEASRGVRNSCYFYVVTILDCFNLFYFSPIVYES